MYKKSGVAETYWLRCRAWIRTAGKWEGVRVERWVKRKKKKKARSGVSFQSRFRYKIVQDSNVCRWHLNLYIQQEAVGRDPDERKQSFVTIFTSPFRCLLFLRGDDEEGEMKSDNQLSQRSFNLLSKISQSSWSKNQKRLLYILYLFLSLKKKKVSHFGWLATFFFFFLQSIHSKWFYSPAYFANYKYVSFIWQGAPPAQHTKK